MTTTSPIPPNKHVGNRRAFALADINDAGFRLYVCLVAFELALKDHNPSNFYLGHDVFAMLQPTFGLAPNFSRIEIAATTLQGDLSRLPCTKKDARTGIVRSGFFPDLRYIRRASDFSPPCANLKDLATALSSFDALLLEVKGHLQWP